MILVHAGNRMDSDERLVPRFATAQIDAVTCVIDRALGDLSPRAVVSAAANGADLILLSVAQRRGVGVHVVLPLPEDEFLRRSVAARDPRWAEAFRRVLGAIVASPTSSLREHDLGADPLWYLTGQDLLLDAATDLLTPDETLVALTVRPPEGEDPPSATDEFARRAVARGLPVYTVDPRPSRTEFIVVG